MDKTIKPIVRNLRNLIRNSTIKYSNDFTWQDIKLSDEFKECYNHYLENNKYTIEFNEFTSVITSSSQKYIFVPNQWFVMASFATDVCRELLKYKHFFLEVSNALGVKPDVYSKELKSNIDVSESNRFNSVLSQILSKEYGNGYNIKEASERVTRFVTDYSWWSGQKTIDRGDFYVSVVLNMLNLVNASQGYVADIAYAYSTNKALNLLVYDKNAYTVGYNDSHLTGVVYQLSDDFDSSYEKLDSVQEALIEEFSSNKKKIIKINSSRMKEIKMRT